MPVAHGVVQRPDSATPPLGYHLGQERLGWVLMPELHMDRLLMSKY